MPDRCDTDRAAPLLARILLVRAVSNIRHRRGGHALWVAKDVAADRGAELEAAGATTRELAHALVPGHNAERDLTPAIAATRRLSHALDRVFKRGMYYQARYHLFSREPEREWRRRVAGVLHAAACAKLDRGNEAAIGDLAVNIHDGRRALDGMASSAWAQQAVSRLEAITTPVFARQEPLTSRKATAIRLLALCLARETDAPGEPFHGVAVGITLLERDTID